MDRRAIRKTGPPPLPGGRVTTIRRRTRKMVKAFFLLLALANLVLPMLAFPTP
jgi:hypothetical protein